jgi:hypothetical protein
MSTETWVKFLSTHNQKQTWNWIGPRTGEMRRFSVLVRVTQFLIEKFAAALLQLRYC